MKISIGPISAEEGTRSQGILRVATRSDGSVMGIPLILVNGRREGPTLCVNAGVHGDEHEGVLAVIKIAKTLNPEKLKGTFVGIPVANFPAFEACRRGNPFDIYVQDMNRIFPGIADGSITERIASVFFQEIITRADYVIALHGGGNQLYNTERVIIQDEIEESLEMAKALSGKWNLIGTNWKAVRGNLAHACAEKGIPAITPELGGASNRSPRLLKRAVGSIVQGVTNVMKHLKMIPGKPAYRKNWTLLDGTPPIYLRANNAGIIRLQQICRLGQKVSDGEAILNILNLFGDEIESLYAPHDGMIVGIPSTPYAFPGNMLAILPRVIKTIHQ